MKSINSFKRCWKYNIKWRKNELNMIISNTPLVSVIITTYKRAEMLDRAINSVINQTYTNLEVIIVDDNNPNTAYRNKTEALMRKYENCPNIKYIKHQQNKNGSAARNTGIRNSSGDFICFLDDDDWFINEKVEKQVRYLVEHPEFDAVYCGWERDNKKIMPNLEGDLTFELLSGTNIVITNSIMMKKKAAIKCGGWDERFRRNQEAVFLLRYFKHGYKIGTVNEILVGFDTSDRSNASSPQKTEEDFDYFLRLHDEQIQRYETLYRNAKKIIYSYRYRGALLGYIKHKDYIGALKLYLKMMKYIPLRFNRDLLLYIFKRTIKII